MYYICVIRKVTNTKTLNLSLLFNICNTPVRWLVTLSPTVSKVAKNPNNLLTDNSLLLKVRKSLLHIAFSIRAGISWSGLATPGRALPPPQRILNESNKYKPDQLIFAQPLSVFNLERNIW